MRVILDELDNIYVGIRKEFNSRHKVILEAKTKCDKCGHNCFQLDFEERVLKSIRDSMFEILNKRIDKYMGMTR